MSLPLIARRCRPYQAILVTVQAREFLHCCNWYQRRLAPKRQHPSKSLRARRRVMPRQHDSSKKYAKPHIALYPIQQRQYPGSRVFCRDAMTEYSLLIRVVVTLIPIRRKTDTWHRPFTVMVGEGPPSMPWVEAASLRLGQALVGMTGPAPAESRPPHDLVLARYDRWKIMRTQRMMAINQAAPKGYESGVCIMIGQRLLSL
jgi:hypothetical protein